MCLIAFSWHSHPVYRLILVANRDEYYDRPTKALHKWSEGIYAGQDLRAGGTWLGAHTSGKVAALTNFRDMPNEREGKRSRGELIPEYLSGSKTAAEYAHWLNSRKHNYNGFNLLLFEQDELWFVSNYTDKPEKVPSGIHGLSNALLNTPWPKLIKAKNQMEILSASPNVTVKDAVELLQSTDRAPKDQLPSTGLDGELEHAVSAQFIHVDNYYGTVNTSVVLWKHSGEMDIFERKLIPEKQETWLQVVSNETKVESR